MSAMTPEKKKAMICAAIIAACVAGAITSYFTLGRSDPPVTPQVQAAAQHGDEIQKKMEAVTPKAAPELQKRAPRGAVKVK